MALLRYLENEPDRACWDAAFRSHPEPNLLAYAVDYLRDHGVNVAKVEHHFGLMVIMLALVNLYANAVNGKNSKDDRKYRQKYGDHHRLGGSLALREEHHFSIGRARLLPSRENTILRTCLIPCYPLPMENEILPQRHRPAHGVHISLGEPSIVWLTVCTKDRCPWMNTATVHSLLGQVWRAADAWSVGRYVLMPDHLHLFCAPRDLNITLDIWVKYWKSQFTKTARKPEWKWQAGHWDTRLRRHESYSEKWMYAMQNPVRAGLVAKPEDWPFRGVISELRW